MIPLHLLEQVYDRRPCAHHWCSRDAEVFIAGVSVCRRHGAELAEAVFAARRHAEELAEAETERAGIVYFAQRSDGAVKIGTTKRPLSIRLSSLRREHGPIVLLGVRQGYKTTESELHERFHRAHILGEWFRPIPRLLSYAAGCRYQQRKDGP